MLRAVHVLLVLCLVMQAVHWRDASGWPACRIRRGDDGGRPRRHRLHARTRLSWRDAERSALAELVIATSNLAVFRANLALLDLGFGLVHGRGVASVLQALATGASSQLVALLGFNLGVEIGQLAIVGLWLPLAYWPPLYDHNQVR